MESDYMIRTAEIEDLPKMKELGLNFANSSQNVVFLPDIFEETWTKLIDLGIGRIFILEDFSGAIGGIITKEPNSGIVTAQEMFWWVNEEKRGISGVKLFKEFESWAKNSGCKRIIMVHLSDLMPEKVRKFYLANNYFEIETTYLKEL